MVRQGWIKKEMLCLVFPISPEKAKKIDMNNLGIEWGKQASGISAKTGN